MCQHHTTTTSCNLLPCNTGLPMVPNSLSHRRYWQRHEYHRQSSKPVIEQISGPAALQSMNTPFRCGDFNMQSSNYTPILAQASCRHTDREREEKQVDGVDKEIEKERHVRSQQQYTTTTTQLPKCPERIVPHCRQSKSTFGYSKQCDINQLQCQQHES